jgi:hypothetical protein
LLQISDAITIFTSNEPWLFGHCWDVLRHEPKWNDKVLELNTPGRQMRSNQQTTPESAQKAKEGMSETHTPSMQANSKYEPRPEGRDPVKNKRLKAADEESSTSPAREMLKKIHEKG